MTETQIQRTQKKVVTWQTQKRGRDAYETKFGPYIIHTKRADGVLVLASVGPKLNSGEILVVITTKRRR